MAVFLEACGGSGNGNSNQNVEDSQIDMSSVNVVEEKIDLNAYGLTQDFLDKYTRDENTDFGELIQSFPAPVEISAIIEDMKVPFSESILFSADQVDNFETNYKRSLGLGVYCADL